MTNGLSEENGQTFVRVTNRDIWDKLNEIEKVVQYIPEDRKRIRSLELKVYTILSGFGIVIAAGGIALLRGVIS